MHAYPDDLAKLVRRRWNGVHGSDIFPDLPENSSADSLPHSAVMRELLSICYQASLMREEGRGVRFRLILCAPERLAALDNRASGLDILPFVRPLRVAPSELRSLAAAAGFERALIGARLEPRARLVIWGLVHSGEDWMRTIEGACRTFQPLPPSPVVTVTGPGNLTVSKGSLAVARLLSGKLVLPTPSVFEISTPEEETDSINAVFLGAHERVRSKRGRHWARVSSALINRLRRQLASRIISAMRRLNHGGTLLILPRSEDCDRRWRKTLTIKYRFRHGETRRQLFRLVLNLLEALAHETGQRLGSRHWITWSDYLESTGSAVRQADEAITEAVRFTACLSAVDGAVVIGQPLEVLGFGAEISGNLSPVLEVDRALDPAATRTQTESALDYGTRHRSAYRICQALPGVVAVVISQDGAARIIKRSRSRVIYSEYLATGVLNF
ncbi:MAG: putative sensor domain DACNV-containing protein [Verrucomicrobiia bacterium]